MTLGRKQIRLITLFLLYSYSCYPQNFKDLNIDKSLYHDLEICLEDTEIQGKNWYIKLGGTGVYSTHMTFSKSPNYKLISEGSWDVLSNDEGHYLLLVHKNYNLKIPFNSNSRAVYTNNNLQNLTKEYNVIEMNINDSKLLFATNIENTIKHYVRSKVSKWQQKGEFEKTYEYSKRVNLETRNKKINEFEKLALDSIKNRFKESIPFNYMKLNRYDADNEVFLFRSVHLGDIPFNVPISYAKKFKDEWLDGYILFKDTEFLLFEGELILSHLKACFSDYSLCFDYDIENKSNYRETEIDYNFAEIEIELPNEISSKSLLKTNTNIISLGSKVDTNIPINKKINNRYALIIGNEDYTSYQTGLSSEQNVDYAENDAKIFKEYALNTLGVKEDNLYYLINATAGQMKRNITLVNEILKELGSEGELIFYYAGHGYPDELTKVPYLIPVDIAANDLNSGVNLMELYNTFSQTDANKITIFLDACFTGGSRNQGLLASRGVKISPKEESLKGNIVVFSASSEKQSSLPFHEERHGMFTYFLLDKLQKTNGNCSYGELFEYIDQKVSLNSLKINEQKQNPKLSSSQNIANNWPKWRFH